MAAKVLNSLAGLYLEKHLAMHRAPGQFEFFHQQADEYRKALANAEEKLTSFKPGAGSGQSNAREGNERTQGRRVRSRDQGGARDHSGEPAAHCHARAQLATLPKRQTTQVRTSDNPQLMQNMKSKLLELELKRTELLAKFEPTYRPVQEVQEQIAQTRSAIEAAEKAPLRDETTDRDPTYEALRSELAKSKTELAATQARAVATSSLIRTYRTESQQLDRKELLHQDMVRAASPMRKITCCTSARQRKRGFQTLLTASAFPTWWLRSRPQYLLLPRRDGCW